jgi:hypothetical protein
MSRRKPLVALAAIMAVLAVAVPAASASAATTAPGVRTAFIGVGGRLVPGSLPCQFLVRRIQVALFFHDTVAANFWSNVFVYSGCGGAAI